MLSKSWVVNHKLNRRISMEDNPITLRQGIKISSQASYIDIQSGCNKQKNISSTIMLEQHLWCIVKRSVVLRIAENKEFLRISIYLRRLIKLFRNFDTGNLYII